MMNSHVKNLLMAATLVFSPTVGAAQQVKCNIGSAPELGPLRFIQDDVEAVIISYPDSVDALVTKFWCAGLTCVNVEALLGAEAGRVIISRPDMQFETGGKLAANVDWELSINKVDDEATVTEYTFKCMELTPEALHFLEGG